MNDDIDAMRNVRDQQIADLLIIALGIAAERQPDLMRSLLASAFDLGAVEDFAKRSMLVATQASQAADEAARHVRELTEVIHADIAGFEGRLEHDLRLLQTIEKRLEIASKVVDALAGKVAAFEARLKRAGVTNVTPGKG